MSPSRFVSVVVCVLIGVQASAGQTPEIRIRPVQIGDAAVTGFVLPPPDPKTTGYFVEVYDVSSAGSRPLLDRKAVGGFDAAGAFTVTLTNPVGPKQEIRVGGPNPVKAQTATTGDLEAPVLRARLHDGARIVRGYLPDPVGVRRVRVLILRSSLEAETGPAQGFVQTKTTTDVDAATGTFSIALDEPLVAGQVVKAQAFTAANLGSLESDAITVTDPGSWGRARAYFAGGVVFSKDREDFSKQDLALTFALDKSWLQSTDFRLGADDAVIQQFVRRNATPGCVTPGGRTAVQERQCRDEQRTTRDEAEQLFGSQGGLRFRQLNTFFDTRLTALPVAAANTNSSTTSSTTGGTTTTTTTTTNPSTADVFRDSRKGALMQIGVYTPFYGPQTSWVHEGAINTFFIAPLFRGGIQTIVGKGDGTPTVNVEGEPDDIFNFWSFGFGVGHQKLSGTTNQTPEVISYLNVTWGKAEAFKYKEKVGEQDVVRDRTRMLVEGRLKIPDTPLQVGFDANLGERNDDIRFIFGTRFDIGEAFSRLRSFER